MNGELAWKDEIIMPVLCKHEYEGTEEKTTILSQYSRSPDRGLNREPSEYEAELLTSASQRSFKCFIRKFQVRRAGKGEHDWKAAVYACLKELF
jgi:hypothetical protein